MIGPEATQDRREETEVNHSVRKKKLLASVGEEKLPPTLLGSVAGPKNKTDIKQINRRKAYFFFFSCTWEFSKGK